MKIFRGHIVLSLLVISILVSIPNASNAENPGNITGSLVDSETFLPLSDINVAFLDATNAVIISTVTTDVNGFYDSGDLSPGDYKLRFVDPADNYLPFYFGVSGGGGGEGEDTNDIFDSGQEITVEPGLTNNLEEVTMFVIPFGNITSTLVDSITMLPITSGIEVTIFDADNAIVVTTTTTNDSGFFDSGDLPGDEHYKLRFVDPSGLYNPCFLGRCGAEDAGGPVDDFVQGSERFLEPNSTLNLDDTEMTLGIPRNITGTLVEAGTLSLITSGIEVTFFDATNAVVVTTTTSDGSGIFDSGDLPIGDYKLRFVDPAETYQTFFLGASSGGGGEENSVDNFNDGSAIIVEPTTTVTFDDIGMTLSAGGIDPPSGSGNIEGRVFDPETGEPLVGIEVTFRDATNGVVVASTLTILVETGEGGDEPNYDSGDLPPGEYAIRVTDSTGNYLPKYFGGSEDTFPGTTVTFGDLQTQNIDIPMDPLPTQNIIGTVNRSFTTDPLEGMVVSFRDATTGVFVAETTTIFIDPGEGGGIDTNFDSGNFPPGEYAIRVSDPSGDNLPRYNGVDGDTFPGNTIVLGPNETQQVDPSIGLSTFQNIIGLVQEFLTGEPIENIAVTFRDATNAVVVATTSTFFIFPDDGGGGGGGATTNFDSDNIPTNDYSLRVSDPAFKYYPNYLPGPGLDVFPGDVQMLFSLNSLEVTFTMEPDDVNPSISAPANFTQECSSPDGTPVDLGLATATDDLHPNPTISNDEPALFPLGDTPVTWTVTDGNNNSDTATQTITLEDSTLPEVAPPANLTFEATAVLTPLDEADYGTATATDDCDSLVVPTSNAPASFPIGDTTIIWTAVDDNDNSSTVEQIITIVDTTLPVVTAPANFTQECSSPDGTPVDLGLATATDIFTPVIVSNDAPALFPLGATEVIWTAVDNNLNPGTATQTITLEDSTLPVVTAPANQPFEATAIFTPLDEADYGTATATDDCDSSVVPTSEPPATFPLGDTTIIWTAVDDNDNSSTVEQIITIVDTTLPEITPPVNQTFEATGSFTPLDETDYGTATATDLFTPVAISSNAPASFPLGDTTIIWTAVDDNDNSSTAEQIITIIDTTSIAITVPDGFAADVSIDGDGNTVITISDTNGEQAETVLPAGSSFPDPWNIDIQVTGLNTFVDLEGVELPPSTTKSVSVASNPGIAFVCLVDSPDSVTQIGLPTCIGTDTSISQVVLECDGTTQHFEGFPDVPFTRDYTCNKVIQGADTFVKVDGLAYSFVWPGVPPVLGDITAPVLVEVGTSIQASAPFTDSDALDTRTAEWDWGDGIVEEGTVDPDSDTVSDSHTYNSPGAYTIQLDVKDQDDRGDSASFQFVVVYDPSGGFVTGGGWIVSPPGADVENPTAIGKANFGFVSKYKKGANIPDGITQFVFKAGDLNFHSTEYDWLVVANHKAMFKGMGTINGEGNYGFIVSAIDANLIANTDVDLFRIQIWDKDNGDEHRYDNQLGDEEDADPTTAIGDGSIVIHTPKGKNS